MVPYQLNPPTTLPWGTGASNQQCRCPARTPYTKQPRSDGPCVTTEGVTGPDRSEPSRTASRSRRSGRSVPSRIIRRDECSASRRGRRSPPPRSPRRPPRTTDRAFGAAGPGLAQKRGVFDILKSAYNTGSAPCERKRPATIARVAVTGPARGLEGRLQFQGMEIRIRRIGAVRN